MEARAVCEANNVQMVCRDRAAPATDLAARFPTRCEKGQDLLTLAGLK